MGSSYFSAKNSREAFLENSGRFTEKSQSINYGPLGDRSRTTIPNKTILASRTIFVRPHAHQTTGFFHDTELPKSDPPDITFK